jgi:hypothetical protein
MSWTALRLSMPPLKLLLLVLLLLAAAPTIAQEPSRRKRPKSSPTWPITVALPDQALPAAGTVVDTLDGRPVYAAVDQLPAYRARLPRRPGKLYLAGVVLAADKK